MFIVNRIIRPVPYDAERRRRNSWIFLALYLIGWVVAYQVIEQTTGVDIPQAIVDAADRYNAVALAISGGALTLAGGSMVAILPRYSAFQARHGAVSDDLRISVHGLKLVTALGALSLGVRLLMLISEGLPVRLRAFVALFEMVWLVLIVDGLASSVQWNAVAYSEMSSRGTGSDDSVD